jgi:hypothetical protein
MLMVVVIWEVAMHFLSDAIKELLAIFFPGNMALMLSRRRSIMVLILWTIVSTNRMLLRLKNVFIMIITEFIPFDLLIQQRLSTGVFQHGATPQTIPLMARQKRKMICRVKTIIIKLRPRTMLLLNKSSKRSHLIRLSRTVRRNTRKLLRPPRLRQPLSITLRSLGRNTTFLQDFFLSQHGRKIIIDAEITSKSLRHK